MVFAEDAVEEMREMLNMKISEYIANHVAKTKGAVKGEIIFFKKFINGVDKTEATTSAKVVIKLTSKKQSTAMPVKVPLKP